MSERERARENLSGRKFFFVEKIVVKLKQIVSFDENFFFAVSKTIDVNTNFVSGSNFFY